MKKIKYLPLFGVSLLALVACGSSNNEISEVKALSLYQLSIAEQYSLVTEKCSVSSDIDAGVKEIFEYGVFSQLPEFEDDFISFANPDNCFFGQAKADSFKSVANYFMEYPTYTLDGKSLTAEFTGSNESEDYGIAMNCSFKYTSAGLIKSAHYTFSYAVDTNGDGKSDSVNVYHGDLTLVWQKA